MGYRMCRSKFPGVYSRVSQAYDWIVCEVCKDEESMQYAAEAGFDCDNAFENCGSDDGGNSSGGDGDDIGGGSQSNTGLGGKVLIMLMTALAGQTTKTF
jgi:hypothetical protein